VNTLESAAPTRSVRWQRVTDRLVRVLGPQEIYGFPSGTAFLSVVLLGLVSYLIWRARPPRHISIVTFGISLPMILLIGLSRVYVGEHWATDVLGGWLIGGTWLLVLVAAHRWWLSGRAKS
jgi:membrane-associated phospholipid phosphatase